MKIFISWSGDRSQALASAMREWLPLVLHYVEPWVSKNDINAGDRWGLEIAKELDGSGFGISCITAENVSAPWLLFKAGALARSLAEGRVVPLLLGLDFSDISGPIAQFQAKKADRDGVLETVAAINSVAAAPVPEPKMQQLFEALWPSFEKKIEAIPTSAKTPKSRPQSEILEELVSSVRNMDARYRDDEMSSRNPRRSKRAHMREMMADEFLHRAVEGPADPISILVVASFFREDYPWIYQLATELYDALKNKNKQTIHNAANRLHDSVQMVSRGPFSGEFDDRNTYMIMKVVDRLVMASQGMGSEKTTSKPTRTIKLV